MQLRIVNKEQYRSHLRNTTFGVIGSLLSGSLLLSSLFIKLVGDVTGTNFNLNLAAVFITSIIIVIFFFNVRKKPYFLDMFYVWNVKFELSHIQRNIKNIESAAINHNTVALDILAYYYQATHQIWMLDDNTLTIDEFIIKENKYKKWVLQSTYQPNVDMYKRTSLQQFK